MKSSVREYNSRSVFSLKTMPKCFSTRSTCSGISFLTIFEIYSTSYNPFSNIRLTAGQSVVVRGIDWLFYPLLKYLTILFWQKLSCALLYLPF